MVLFGQRRAMLVWERLVMPNGASLALDNALVTDAAGYAGLSDGVDFHTWRLLRGIGPSTLLGVGTKLSFGDGEGDLRALRESIQSNADRLGQKVVERNLDIHPTFTVRPGFPVRVLVRKDFVLSRWRGLSRCSSCPRSSTAFPSNKSFRCRLSSTRRCAATLQLTPRRTAPPSRSPISPRPCWPASLKTIAPSLAGDDRKREEDQMQDMQTVIDRPSRILRIKAVMQRTGLTRATLYRKVADGTFPRQIQISTRCVGWRESAVDAWLRTPVSYRPGNEV